MIDLLRSAVRLLTFRSTREEMLAWDGRHLAFGLVCTWLAGIGRYYDNPRAGLVQMLGVGSVVYVFFLAAFLAVAIAPLRPRDGTYRRMLTFITLTAPPAFLYALPIELWCTVQTASTVNSVFLGIVASWRVALLLFYLVRFSGLRWYAGLTALTLPLMLIVVLLTLLNLEHVAFDIMAGIRDHSPGDDSYLTVMVLAFLSVYGFIPVLIVWAILVVKAHRRTGEPGAASSPPAVAAP